MTTYTSPQKLFLLPIIIAIGLLANSAKAQQLTPGAGPGGGGAQWDPSSLIVLQSNGVAIDARTHSDGSVHILAARSDTSQNGDFACALLSTDHSESLLCYGNVDTNGAMTTTFARANASDNPGYFGGSSGSRSEFSQFWGDYWHYLTHPWDMDDDLETGFYVAVGTAAVAGTAAATIVVVEAVVVTEVGVAVAGTGGAASTGGGGVLLGAEAEIAAAYAEIAVLEADIAAAEVFIAAEQAAAAEGLAAVSIDEIIFLAI